MGWVSVGGSVDFAIHAALLHTGRAGQILLDGGDQHDPVRAERANIAHTRIFDCAARIILDPPPPSPNVDVFCSGHALMADGRFLQVGGTETFPQDSPPAHAHEGHFTGQKAADIFDPETLMWSRAQDMAHGRWYPTVVALPSGNLLVLGGHTDAQDLAEHANNRPEIYEPSVDNWVLQNPVGPSDPPLYFPRAFALPNWKVFVATPIPDTTTSAFYSPLDDTWSAIASATIPAGYEHYETSAVLLPLTPENDYRPRVLMTGKTEACLIDLSAPSPSWTTSVRSWPGGTPPVRNHGHAVLLPTGDVFVCGGVEDDKDYSVGSADTTRPEIYSPDLTAAAGPGTWTRVDDPAPRYRGYHSVALLMPDGCIWIAGSQKPRTAYSFHNEASMPFDERGPDGDGLNPDGSPVRNLEYEIDIYEPDYVHHERPTIAVVPAAVQCGSTFTLYTPDADLIRRVAMVRAGSATHAFNSDQRYVGLTFTRASATTLAVHAPPSEGVAPPGYYMVFVIDANGTPSVGVFTRVLPAPCTIGSLLDGNASNPGQARTMGARFREVRDHVLVGSPVGEWVVPMLARHSAELVKILEENPKLAHHVWVLLLQVDSLLAATSDPMSVAVPDHLATSSREAVDRLHEVASPELRDELEPAREILKRMPDSRVAELVGMGARRRSQG
jgi:hypothetical protein